MNMSMAAADEHQILTYRASLLHDQATMPCHGSRRDDVLGLGDAKRFQQSTKLDGIDLPFPIRDEGRSV